MATVDRKINFFGLVDISRPIPQSGKENLDGFRYRPNNVAIDWYVPTRQVEVTTPGVLIYRFRYEAFNGWDLEKQVNVGETIKGPRRWYGCQIRYSVTP